VERLVLIALVALLAGCGGGDNDAAVQVRVELADMNGSGQEGEAAIEQLGRERVRIEIELSGAPARAQPAYLVLGGCSTFEPRVGFELEPVENGRSTTELGTSIGELTTGGYGLAVGGKEPSAFVACGDVLP
jgi:hypothetical protein